MIGYRVMHCPYLLMNGKCSMDKTGNTICMEEDKSHICEYGKEKMSKKFRKKKKDGEQE